MKRDALLQWNGRDPVRPWLFALASVVAMLAWVPPTSGQSADRGATVTASALKGSCVRAGTALPKILDRGPWLYHPGDRKTQSYGAEVDYPPLPKGCKGVFRRKPEVKFQIQNPRKHRQWINAGEYRSPIKTRDAQDEELEALEQEREERGESCWRPIPGGERNVCRIDIHIGNEGGKADTRWSPPRRLHEPSYARHDPRLYRCTAGRGITHVRALFKNTVLRVGSGKIVARRTTVVPVRVKNYGTTRGLKTWRGAVKGPC